MMTTDDYIYVPGENDLEYIGLDDIDFSIIAMGLKELPFYEDDLYLGMQAMNISVADSVITQNEYSLLRKFFEIERTPMDLALIVSSLSQMWVFGLYEVLRQWKDRHYKFQKLFDNCGIDQKIAGMSDDPMNLTVDIRKRQLLRYKDDASYRERIAVAWDKLEDLFHSVELYRMNLAKHCSPGKDNSIPRAPGYGRINMICGSMDYELIIKSGDYVTMSRRDIADELRECLSNA